MGETIGARTQVAKKRHGCNWCRVPIEPGDTYDRWLYKDGGDVYDTKIHAECWAFICELRERNNDRGDEFPCYDEWHEKGRGCWDCDPDNSPIVDGKDAP